MNKYISAKIAEIEEYIPQSDAAEIILDANESPFDLPKAVQEQLPKLIAEANFNRYPDSTAKKMTEAFAEAYPVDSKCVAAGNGSDELISLLAGMFLTSGDRFVVAEPDFSMYRFYGSYIGAAAAGYQKSDNFDIDFKALSQYVSEHKAGLVIFSNPCNPTGKAYDTQTVLDFVKNTDALVVVDEAYMEFCRDGCSVLPYCAELENLIVLKTLSKAYGCAAIRAGFLISNEEIAAAVRKVKSPYNVNTLTQLIGTAVLKESATIREHVKVLVNERNRLMEALLALPKEYGLTPCPSDANFIFVKTNGSAKKIYQQLLSYGIRVRLMKNNLRITAGSPAENQAVIAALGNLKL